MDQEPNMEPALAACTEEERQEAMGRFAVLRPHINDGVPLPELTITHIDFLSVWPHASPRPVTSSHAGHATRSARQASRPSDDSGDHRDGLSTTPLARASASTWLALYQTWPPRRRIRPHSATPWP